MALSRLCAAIEGDFHLPHPTDLAPETWDRRDLPALLALDLVAPDRFRNRLNEENAYALVFGGQIVAQALSAADATVAGRSVHSLHGYFLRAGSAGRRVDFRVERVRDGGRFSTRRVVATQDDAVLFTMDCSYRVELDGFDHQQPSSVAFEPENAIDFADLARSGRTDLLPFVEAFAGPKAIEVRIPEEAGFLRAGIRTRRHYYLRVPSAASSDDPTLHRRILAYLTDFLLPGAPLVPYLTPLPGPHLFVASLDHAIWFHRPVRVDDWLLFETESPSAQGAVNLARALVYDRAGRLVASVVQESLQLATKPAPGA
jgi:acyl-CoA thioesterase-2